MSSIFNEEEYGTVDQVVEDLQESAPSSDGTLDEAVARIEEANLWKTLYSTEVFPPGSAREGIRNRLNDKLRNIALEEIQVLLGMRQVTRASLLESAESERQKETLSVLSHLDIDQVNALVKLANKVLQRPDQETIQAPQSYVPKVSTISAAKAAQPAPLASPAVAPKAPKRVKNSKGQTRPAKSAAQPLPPASAETLIATGAVKASPPMGGELGKAIGGIIQTIAQGNILHVDNNNSNDGDDVNERF